MRARHFALLFSLFPSLAGAAPTRAQVERLLAGYEPQATAASFQRLGAGTDKVLIAIAADAATSPLRRVRALAALQWVPTAEGQAACQRVVREEGGALEGQPVLEVVACARTLGAFGASASADLVPLVSHPLAEVRIAAAHGLAAAKATGAIAALQDRLAVEDDAAAKDALARAVRVLQAR